MIAQKIERHFLQRVQAQQQSKNNMKFIEQVSSQLILIQSDSFFQVDQEASKLCQNNVGSKRNVSNKQIKEIQSQTQQLEETSKKGNVLQNDSQTITPLAVPEVQDLEQIPNLDDNLFPVQNSKNKQNLIKRKAIRKRFKTQQKSAVIIDSNNSLPTSLDLKLEGEALEKNSTDNQSFLNNQKPTHESKEQSIEGELIKQIQKEDFNQPKNRINYYTDKLINLIKGDLDDTFMAQMYINHFIQTYGILQKLKVLKQPQSYEILNKIKPQIIKQKTLVIDLDETLVHYNESTLMPKDLVININLNNGLTINAEISVRPYAQQFLQNLAQHFEIMIYTASNEDYANQIIDYLDPTQQLVKYRFYRNDCINLYKGCHIKDLRTLDRNLKDIILIDNSAYSFAYQLNNGIPIIPYIDNKKDDELIVLEKYLMELLEIDDIRIENEKNFHLQQIQNSNSIQQAVNYLIHNKK
ncbi:unnamed protein product [Paramecium sonneborni]|uniref:FCP1 homology domain-containing protein n=1 Tax=Paramecium sonneborni TaxID=65129 RepID=A0A8S1R4X7_9CILI|nr:unnamed protein product [Paramecium sonneborni]